MALDPLARQPVAGRTGIDPANTQNPENNLNVPWGVDPATSWLDYRCWLETELDPGTALHKPLPQQQYTPDTLALIDAQSPNLDTTIPTAGGVNLKPKFPVTDVIQRMATSTYRFTMRGYGLRAGYQIPIPGLVSVGNVPAVPVNVHRAYNVIVGEHGGVPIWFATWELHYIIGATPSPGEGQVPVPFNAALHIRSDAELPQSITVPQTTPDQADVPGEQVVVPIVGGVAQP